MDFYELSTPESIALYIVIVIGATLSMHAANRYEDSGKAKGFVVLAFMIVTIPAVFKCKVGFDYESFYEHGLQVQNKASLVSAIAYRTNVESSFSIMMYLLGKVGLSPAFGISIYAFLCQLFMILGFWNYRKYVKPEAAVFLYTCSFYLRTYNLIRQTLAVAIIFWASYYIIEKKLIRFSIAVLFATLIHRSAIVAIMLIWFLKPQKKKSVIWNPLYYIIPIIAIFFLDKIYDFASQVNLLSRYVREYSVAEQKSFVTLGTLLVLVEAVIYVIYRVRNNNRFVDNDKSAIQEVFDRSLYCDVIFYFLGFTISTAARIGLYFTVLKYCALASVCGKSYSYYNKHRFTIFQLLFFAIGVAHFVSCMNNNGYGQLPYRFLLL